MLCRITILLYTLGSTGCGQWTPGSTDHALDCIDGCTEGGDRVIKGERGEVGPAGPSGLPGRDGENGQNGQTGAEGPQGIPGAIGSSGPRGETGQQGETGSTGAPGADGRDGVDGVSGVGCSVIPAINGGIVTCGDNSVLILNGDDGADGEPGQDAPPTAYTIAGLVDPCGDAAGIYDEVFLRLQNGMLIASFSDNANGKNTRFSVITPGSYMTTDGDQCYFSIDTNLQLYNEHH